MSCLVPSFFQQFPLPHSASSSASRKKMVQRSTSFDFLFLWSMCPSSFILNSKTYSVPTWLTESTCFSNLTHSKITACHVSCTFVQMCCNRPALKIMFPWNDNGNIFIGRQKETGKTRKNDNANQQHFQAYLPNFWNIYVLCYFGRHLFS